MYAGECARARRWGWLFVCDVIKGKLKASCRPWNYDMDSEEFCPVS